MAQKLPYGIKRILFTEDEIQKRVKQIASEINKTYKDEKEPLVLIGVLKGSFMFLADIAKYLTVPHIVDFIALSSYGKSSTTKSTGNVRMIMDTREDLFGRNVLVVEDILDTGYTLAFINTILKARGIKSLKNAVLLEKNIKHEADIKIDYLGFECDNYWVVGEGLDYKEMFRTLPYIAELDIDKLNKEEK